MLNPLMEQKIRIDRIWAMASANTFSIKPIKELLIEEIGDTVEWIDPFARNNKFGKYRNDINKTTEAEYHLDAVEFLRKFQADSMDGGLGDWVYSPRQLSECYQSNGIPVTGLDTSARTWKIWRTELGRVIKPGGKAITFGWSSGGIGMKYGFMPYRILIVPHGGMHNDTIVTCEIKI